MKCQYRGPRGRCKDEAHFTCSKCGKGFCGDHVSIKREYKKFIYVIIVCNNCRE